MLPSQLTPADFDHLPPEARKAALDHLDLLRSLPLAFAPFLLQQISTLDLQLPAERRDLLHQLAFLSALSPAQRSALLAPFASISLGSGPDSPSSADWPRDPAAFIERLTAHLWSTHQMLHFRGVADTYAAAVAAASPPPPPGPPRLGIVLIGHDAPPPATPLFARLRPFGVHLTAVDPTAGLPTLLAELTRRAEAHPQPFAHWLIDGGPPSLATPHPALTSVSYTALQPARDRLLSHTEHAISTGIAGPSGPEALRSQLARLTPADLGLPPGPLSHFQLSLLTEGSGTQIFATTFVQWAARECLRRAAPSTLLLRFAPRQQALSMDAMLGGTPATGPDPAGSLIDADEAAWLTFLNLRRLPTPTLVPAATLNPATGADTNPRHQARNKGPAEHAAPTPPLPVPQDSQHLTRTPENPRFLVWFESQNQALVIGPGLPGNTTSTSPMTLRSTLNLLA